MAISKDKLPYNLSIEKQVLGLMITSRSASFDAFARLSEDDFYKVDHKKIFTALYNLNRNNKMIDVETVIEELKNEKNLESIGGFDYIREIVDSVISENAIGEYLDILKENTNLRNMLIELNLIEDEYLNKKIDDKNRFVADIQKRINKIADLRKISNFLSANEVASRYSRAFEDLISNKSRRALTGLDTGYNLLNYYTDGLQKQNLIIVAGRTGMGKTTFALNLMLNVAMREKKTVAIFEIEMSASQLFMRLVSNRSSVDSYKIQNGRNITDEEKMRIDKSISDLSRLSMYIDESPSLTLTDIETKSRKLKQEKGDDLGLIVIDHLGIINSELNKNKKFDSRQLEIGDYTRRIHELSRELNIPIVLVCQLSRKATEREGPPKLADLRESGSIEQDAELVLLLHREDYEKNELDKKVSFRNVTAANMNEEERKTMMDNINNKATIASGVTQKSIDNKTSMMTVIIAKNRNGQSDKNVDLIYQKNYFKFKDKDPRFDEKINQVVKEFNNR